MASKSTIPLVKADMMWPYIRKAEAEVGTISDILTNLGYDDDELEREDFVPVTLWYELVERLSKKCSDKYFGYEVGNQTAFHAIPCLSMINDRIASLGDILGLLIVESARHSNIANYTLHTDGKMAKFEQKRTFRPPRKPAQIDASVYGFFARIIRNSVGHHWKPESLTYRLSDPSVLPASETRKVNLNQGSWGGWSFAFPAIWLHSVSGQLPNLSNIQSEVRGMDLVVAVQRIIGRHIGDKNLNEKMIAETLSLSVRTMQTHLIDAGTSYRDELAQIREAKAIQKLRSSNESVKDIGEALGYRTATGFIRAFKRWKGKTPMEFRMTPEAPDETWLATK